MVDLGYADKGKQREYQRQWVAGRRDAFFCDKKCTHCSTSEDLQLHHLDPTQKESHSIWGWGDERRLPEIEKCIVLCKPCHYKVHGKKIGRTCGKFSTYKYGCRCDKCKAVGADYNKARRLRYKKEKMEKENAQQK